jgi:hypothetical protein
VPLPALAYDRYLIYWADRKGLGAACYFCLTVLAQAAGNRLAAAKQFGIASSVLSKIGEVTTNQGGNEASRAYQGSPGGKEGDWNTSWKPPQLRSGWLPRQSGVVAFRR